MWKKPSIQKPDFKKLSLDELSEKESLDTNGGIAEIPTRLSGMIGPPIIPIIPPLSGVIAKPFDINKPIEIDKPIEITDPIKFK